MLLYLLLEGSCAIYKTLLSNPKLTNVLKILTESAHNYLYQDLSPNLNQKQRSCLHRHKRFLCQLASSNSVRGKVKAYKINLLLNNRAGTKAIIEPLLSSLKEHVQLEQFNNVSKIPSSTGKWGRESSSSTSEGRDDVGTSATDSYGAPNTSNNQNGGAGPSSPSTDGSGEWVGHAYKEKIEEILQTLPRDIRIEAKSVLESLPDNFQVYGDELSTLYSDGVIGSPIRELLLRYLKVKNSERPVDFSKFESLVKKKEHRMNWIKFYK